MQVELSIEELELIAEATFQQTLAKKREHERAVSLINGSVYHSTSAYLSVVSNIGHELNALRDLTHTIERILYKHNNQIK